MKIIFLDRDDTLNHDPGYLSDPNLLHLKEGVIEGMNLLKLAGFEFIIITNQSGIARGLISEQELNAVHKKLKLMLSQHDLSIKKIYYCPDQDDFSPCRKPNPKMIDDAIKDFPVDLEHSYIIGDRHRDILTGIHFSIPGILIKGQKIENENETPTNLIKKVDNFLNAAQYILQHEYEKTWRYKIYHKADDHFFAKIVECKKNQHKIVFTNGCFDLWHGGHLQYLAEAAQLGDYLVIGLNSDASVRKLKGSNRPILPVEERALKLAHLSFVNIIIIFEESTPIEIIKKIKPDVHVKGGDYKKENLPEFSVLNKLRTEIIILPFREGFSSSGIIDKILRSSS